MDVLIGMNGHMERVQQEEMLTKAQDYTAATSSIFFKSYSVV